jgi:hypothetical protein
MSHTHLFDDARHATEIRTRMAASPFARLLEPTIARATRRGDRSPAEARFRTPPAERQELTRLTRS